MPKDRETAASGGGGISSFGELPTGNRTESWESGVPMFKYPAGKWVHMRLLGKLFPGVRHWLKTKNQKNFSVLCHNYNPASNKFDLEKTCPCCKLGLKWSRIAWCNAIIRKYQKGDSSNPVRVVPMSGSVTYKIKEIMEGRGGVEPTDSKKGWDLEILNNPHGDPSTQYNVQRGDKTPLTEDELEFELTPLHKIVKPLPLEEVEGILERFGYTAAASGDDDDEADEGSGGDDDDTTRRSGSKPTTPAKKPSSGGGAKKPPADEDEWGDDDDKMKPPADDDDDAAPAEEEEEAPPPKQNKKPPAKPEKKPVKPADDDDDAEEAPASDDDDEETPPAKPNKKPAGKPEAKKPPAGGDKDWDASDDWD